MREKLVEEKLVRKVRSLGGQCLKWTSPGTAGVPDRIVILPRGVVAFVEVKAPGEKLRPLQVKRLQQLEALGCETRVVDSEESIETFISDMILWYNV